MSAWLDKAVQNVIDGNGIVISIAAMLIVFTALTLLSLFIAALPRFLKIVARVLPEEHPAGPPPVDERIVAAIGCVLRRRKYGSSDGHSS